jgi:outer membrane protein assembly factor BamA
MNLSQIKFGYNWRTSPKREYRIEPVSIDYLRLTETSAEFDQFLEDYPQVALSFEEQFIIGSTASYVYTSTQKRRQRNQFYYNGTLDVAGNLVDAVYRLAGPSQTDSASPNTLLGSPYAQYAKVTNDLRYYYFITEKAQIASRLLAGIGVPYGNSEVLPYVKQYFAGGSQDIRAFYARSLGPGSYTPPDSLQQQGFLDQSGEIKLMGSIEYRFPITYNVYGAFFLDAGNVWLIDEDESRPGGKFEFDKFLDDIAVGTGLGLRVDIEYFVVRLDMGIPVRKPYLTGNEQWIFSNSSFFGDYILSLAVGYPF